MKTISFISYNSGVGKTTLVSNVGAELAFRGERVLLIDLNPQADLTLSLISDDLWSEYLDEKTIKNWFNQRINEASSLAISDLIIQPIEVNNRIQTWDGDGELDLICSHIALNHTDFELISQNENDFIQLHTWLRSGLSTLRNRYDFVLIDCVPSFDLVTRSAVIASDGYIIPATPDFLSTIAISMLDQILQKFISFFKKTNKTLIEPECLGVIFTRLVIDGNKPIADQKNFIAQVRRMGLRYFNSFIRENDCAQSDQIEFGIPFALQDSEDQNLMILRAELENFTDEILALFENDG